MHSTSSTNWPVTGSRSSPKVAFCGSSALAEPAVGGLAVGEPAVGGLAVGGLAVGGLAVGNASLGRKSRVAIVRDAGPLRRMMLMPPAPTGVAIAVIVSLKKNSLTVSKNRNHSTPLGGGGKGVKLGNALKNCGA